MSEFDRAPLLGALGWVLLYYGVTLGGLMAVLFAFPDAAIFCPLAAWTTQLAMRCRISPSIL